MLGDLWALDTGSSAWAELDAEGKTPHVRCSQAVAAVGSDIFMLGGSYYKWVISRDSDYYKCGSLEPMAMGRFGIVRCLALQHVVLMLCA